MFSGVNDPSRWVLPAVLEELAVQKPDGHWIETTTGEYLAFGEAAADMRRASGYLAQLGVRHGDRVTVFMGSSIDFVRVWLGITRLGAIAVLLNPELSGSFLCHQINNAGSSLAIVDETLLPQLQSVEGNLSQLQRVIIVGDGPHSSSAERLRYLPWAPWRDIEQWEGPMPAASDIAAVMYTSGTSGPSKGVLMPHAHCTLYGIGLIEATGLSERDTYYITMPLFHANGLLLQLGSCLLCGIRAILRPRFSATNWLRDIRQHDVTVTSLLGSMSAFVLAQEPSVDDRDHRLRAVVSSPNMPEHDNGFRTRFGVDDVLSGFGMTEVNIPIWGRRGKPVPGAAGWVYDRYFDVVIANPDTDLAVERGTVGEILVRPKAPFGFMAGYLGLPEKTVEAWRNLWFHTGDAATMNKEGLVVFIDRIKDCIRRRGENISPSEIEAVVAAMPMITEVAAYAVPSDISGGEDEIMLAIVAPEGTPDLLGEIARAADQQLPRFAKPRYLKLLEELPKTMTGKIQRSVLRGAGTHGALDREAPSA